MKCEQRQVVTGRAKEGGLCFSKFDSKNLWVGPTLDLRRNPKGKWVSTLFSDSSNREGHIRSAGESRPGWVLLPDSHSADEQAPKGGEDVHWFVVRVS